MTSQMETQLAAIRDCWITGGNAADLAPDAWRTLLDNMSAEERERCLVAVAGQALDVAFRPSLPRDVLRQSDLPRLSLPTIPDSLRSLFRHALKQLPNWSPPAALRIAEQRGFCAHPLDWMPEAASGTVSALYIPWLDWVQSLDSEEKRSADELNEDTWDSFYPFQRILLLKAMRAKEPTHARELIAAKSRQEPAEKRLAVIETLAVGLCDNDAPYLQSLSNERSGKIKALAARLLARLHFNSESLTAADLAELTDFFKVGSKGIIKRTKTVCAKPLKSQAKVSRRIALLDALSLVEFAAAFDATEAEIIDAWEFNEHETHSSSADASLAKMVAQSASDELVANLASRVLDENRPVEAVLTLLPRLDRNNQRRVMLRILEGESLELLLCIEHGDLAKPEDIFSCNAYKDAKAKVSQEQEKNSSHAITSLNALAVVATAEAAEAVLNDVFATFGIFRANPALALLRLNFELASATVSV